MAFLETTALITELWSASQEAEIFKATRQKMAPSATSTLVLREFHQIVTATLIKIHTLLTTEIPETRLLHELGSDSRLGPRAVQVYAALKERLGAFDSNSWRYVIEALLQGDIEAELRLIIDKISDRTACEVAPRRVSTTPLGFYELDSGCRKATCGCSSPALVQRHVTAPKVVELSQSTNPDIGEMVPLLEQFLKGDTRAILGTNCNKIADLLHVVEAKEEGHAQLISSDKAIPELSSVLEGPIVEKIAIKRLMPRKDKTPRLKLSAVRKRQSSSLRKKK